MLADCAVVLFLGRLLQRDAEFGDRPIDQAEQANYYQAQFQTFWNEPWFMGWCWWQWPAHLYKKEDAARDREFCIYGKQAEGVVREWYAKPHDAVTK